jgi:molecular chaperone GrpE
LRLDFAPQTPDILASTRQHDFFKDHAMSSLRKDQQRPQTEAGEAPLTGEVQGPASGEAAAAPSGPIDKSNVMKSFYQRAIEERDEKIEKLEQDNKHLRAKIISASVSPAAAEGESDTDWDGDAYSQLKRSSDLGHQVVTTLMADKDKLTAEVAESKDKVMRTLAELENVRRRTEREKLDISKYAVSEFARDVIGLGDTIQRAIEHVPAEAAANDPALKSFLEGVQMMERELLATLERHGVVRDNPEGEKFDPNRHQAVMEKENPDVPPGTIVQVLQSGFMIGERTLRPAVVMVARGGSKTPKVVEAAPVEVPVEDAGAPQEPLQEPPKPDAT